MRNKLFAEDSQNVLRRARISYIHPSSRAPPLLLAVREEESEESVSKRGGRCAPARIACAVRPVIARGFSDLDFRGPSLLTGPSSLRLPIPLCRLSSDPPSRGVFSPLLVALHGFLPSSPISRQILPSVSLVRARIAALRLDILSVLFWGTSGGWHADKGNLLAQEILSQEARGWLAHAVRLIYLLLVSDVECL